jgi:hypothetical protein
MDAVTGAGHAGSPQPQREGGQGAWSASMVRGGCTRPVEKAFAIPILLQKGTCDTTQRAPSPSHTNFDILVRLTNFRKFPVPVVLTAELKKKVPSIGLTCQIPLGKSHVSHTIGAVGCSRSHQQHPRKPPAACLASIAVAQDVQRCPPKSSSQQQRSPSTIRACVERQLAPHAHDP